MLLFPVLATADQLYKSVDEEGNAVYTDIPPDEKAQEIKLPKVNITPSIKAFDLNTHAKSAAEPPKYRSLKVISPEHNSTIFINTSNLAIQVQAIPAVMSESGHSLQILLDGNILSEGTRTSMALDTVDRGSHIIITKVIDDKGKVIISSEPVVVHIRKPSKLNP